MAACLVAAVLMVSCVSGEGPDTDAKGVAFAAAVCGESEVSTRSGADFVPLSVDNYGGIPFYIHAEVATAQGTHHERATYEVAPGGRLIPTEVEAELLWYNKKSSHTFYAWTMPWQEDEQFLKNEPGAQSVISFLPSTYESLSNEDDRVNCGVLERFVATRTQPLTYNINGELVELYFQHLVSKIKINVARLVGDIDFSVKGAEAYMTFIDMPREGIFFRHPDDGRPPYVEKKDDTPKGVTCWIGNKSNTLYVCPGIDFSDMRFAIHLNDGHGNRSDYHGDFRSVIFKRPDENLGDWDVGKKNTVLYAGEEMTINLAMSSDATDFSVTINRWSEKTRSGTSHARQGVYTSTELQDLYNKFSKEYTEADVQEIFDLFGVEDENGQKIIPLYEDLVLNHTRLPLDPSLILDGMGHVLQLGVASRTFPGDPTDQKRDCAHVPRCRNIFLTDGEHMLYIDEDYHIWKVDPNTLEMTDTGYDLGPLPDGRKSYYIDYATGETYASSGV